MNWIFFLVICPGATLDYCEPRWNDMVFETKTQCEQALKEEVAAYTDEDTTVFQASCRQQKAKKKTPEKAEEGDKP